MNRHYHKTKLLNLSGQRLIPDEESVWALPPYVVAKFGGELSRVMLKAAERYIYEKSLSNQQQLFKNAAFPNKINS